jgi:hypothetical protein
MPEWLRFLVMLVFLSRSKEARLNKDLYETLLDKPPASP